MPVTRSGGEYQTLLGLPPEEGGYANDPVLGRRRTTWTCTARCSTPRDLRRRARRDDPLVATNAGVIGASRITYSMATYRQLPEVFRRLHPRFRTPWLALVFFAGSRRSGDPPRPDGLPRDDVLVRRDALVHDRARGGDRAAGTGGRTRSSSTAPGRTSASAASTGRSSRSSAGSGPGIAWLVVVVQEEPTRWVGLAWLASASPRTRSTGARAARSRCARPCARRRSSSALEIEYRTIVVPGSPLRRDGGGARRRRAPGPERGATIVLVPWSRCRSPAARRRPARQEAEADEILDEARALVEATACGWSSASRARRAGPGGRGGGRAPGRRADRRRSVARRSCAAAADVRQDSGLHPRKRARRASLSPPGSGRHRSRWRDPRRLLMVLGIGSSSDERGLGGGLGLLLGVLLVVAGAFRLYLRAGCAWLGSSRSPARPRDALARRGRLRRDRLVALLRARGRRAPARSGSPPGCCSASALLFLLVALSYAEGTRRCRRPGGGHIRAARVQRPAGLLHRLGALPRLPDRDRARRVLRAALPRARARLGLADRQPGDFVVGIA